MIFATSAPSSNADKGTGVQDSGKAAGGCGKMRQMMPLERTGRLHARLRGRLAGRGARDGLLVVGARVPIDPRLRSLAARVKSSNASALSASATVGAEHSLASSTHRLASCV